MDKAAPSPSSRRIVTILFADVVGSTALIERMDAEQAWEALSSPVDLMVQSVERFGGTVCRRLGDGLMAVFGAPLMQEDHAIRACQAALAMQSSLRRSDAPSGQSAMPGTVQLRVGINSGPVMVASASDGLGASYDTIGAPVNLAARIQAAVEPGAIGISEFTFHRIGTTFATRPLGALRLKGFTQPQPAFELVRWQSGAPTRGLRHHSIVAPLIGRTEEVARIDALTASLAKGEGGVVLIVGDAGIGKSRLLAEARNGLGEDVQWFESHSFSFGESFSFWTFIELLKPMLELEATADDEANWDAFEGKMLEFFGLEATEVIPYIAALLGLKTPDAYAADLSHLDPRALSAQIFRAVFRLFEVLAEIPVVIAFDDIQWADASSRALLLHLLPLAKTRRLLFIVSSRPEPSILDPLRKAAADILPDRITELRLSALSGQNTDRLVASILGNHPQTGPIRNIIRSKADGNPFFVEEVVRALIDAGVLARVESGWTVQNRDITIPDTIQGVVIARVDQLDKRLKDILGTAAVVGRTFLYRVLRAVTADDLAIDENLARLKAVELIDEMQPLPELTYLFKHPIAHEAIYQNLLREFRRQTHLRVAECLRSLYVDREDEIASVLAFHFARGESWDDALQFLTRAADLSVKIAGDSEALVFYEQAVETYARAQGHGWGRAQRATIENGLGEIYFRRGDHVQAVDHLAKAIALYGDILPSGRLAVALATAKELLKHAFHMVLHANPELVITPDAEAEARLRPYELLGWIYFLSDQSRIVLAVLRAANLAHEVRIPEGLAKALAAVGLGFDMHGLPRLANWYLSRALAIVDRVDHPLARPFIYLQMGVHKLCRGELEAAHELLFKARQGADSVGDLILWSDATVVSCEVACEMGDYEWVLATSEWMITVGRESAMKPAVRWGLLERGKALRRVGRLTEARPVLEEALELATGSQDIISAHAAAGELALLLMDAGEEGRADQVLEELEAFGRARKIRMFPICWSHLASSELRLRQLQRNPGDRASRRNAGRACKASERWAHRYRIALPGALRLQARLAWLTGRKRKAEVLWQRAITVAQEMGARHELVLAQREMNTYVASSASARELAYAGSKPTRRRFRS